jgi:hypothetical protein
VTGHCGGAGLPPKRKKKCQCACGVLEMSSLNPFAAKLKLKVL